MKFESKPYSYRSELEKVSLSEIVLSIYSRNALEGHYQNIYGTTPPESVNAEQLRNAVFDGSGNFKQPILSESDQARIKREEWEREGIQ